jgi:hypothetical protein
MMMAGLEFGAAAALMVDVDDCAFKRLSYL